MRNQWGRLLAAVLAAGLLALPVRADVAGGKLDLDRQCTLTIVPGNFGDSEYEADFKEANVVIDLYKVADAVAEPGQGAYGYSFLGGYQELADGGTLALKDLTGMANEDWKALAQRAAEATLAVGQDQSGKAVTAVKEAVKAQAVLTGAALDTKNSVESGLYLVIARGAADASYMEYMEVPGEAEGTEKQLVTTANSQEYTYSFFPELISLPSTSAVVAGAVDENGDPLEISTDSGNWQYDLTAALKASRDIRFGRLEIVKTLPVYEDSGPVAFVFQVDGYRDSAKAEKIYSDVVSITFNAPGQLSAVVENIPANSYVEVTEIYSGAAYELTTEGVRSTTIVPGEAGAQVYFDNTYNENRRGGGAVTNQFEYGEDGKWIWVENPEGNE